MYKYFLLFSHAVHIKFLRQDLTMEPRPASTSRQSSCFSKPPECWNFRHEPPWLARNLKHLVKEELKEQGENSAAGVWAKNSPLSSLAVSLWTSAWEWTLTPHASASWVLGLQDCALCLAHTSVLCETTWPLRNRSPSLTLDSKGFFHVTSVDIRNVSKSSLTDTIYRSPSVWLEHLN